MNIFVLSRDPKDAAQQHCDKHVIKMILETTQLLYMCLAFFDEDKWRETIETQLLNNQTLNEMNNNGQKVNFNSYKAGKGHMNHPCSKWLRESKSNYLWLCNLGLELCKEKIHRWPKNKQHSCLGHIEVLLENIPIDLPDIGLTQFKLAMPDECKVSDAVESYQNYYNNNKQKLLKWSNRDIPLWIKIINDNNE